jgi:hypothetical protein
MSKDETPPPRHSGTAQAKDWEMTSQEPETKFRINAMFVVGLAIGIILVVAMLYEFAGK